VLSVILLVLFILLAARLSPRENPEHAHIHGAGQIGLLAAVALFGVDYFTSYYYATGEMMSALHPYGLQDKAYLAVGVIAFANFAFGLLYMFSLGPFNEGGGSYTASMRYLWPTLSLIVAVALIQDYVLTIVVSALSGGDQLLSILGLYGKNWLYHFALGAVLAAVTWYLTIRGRGESARVVFVDQRFRLAHRHAGRRPAAGSPAGVPVPPDALERSRWGGHVTHADGLDERHGGADRSGGGVNGSSSCRTMTQESSWGKRHFSRLQWLWTFSGKSGIAGCADFVPLLRRADHPLPDGLRHPLRCL
jgi:hypothetical protein